MLRTLRWYSIYLRTYTQNNYTPTMLQGWGEVVANIPTLGFAGLQYFEHMLHFIDSLLCALQDKVNIMVYGAASGL